MIFDKLLNVHYLDNAATDRYKPCSVINAVTHELHHSANAGRGGHAESIRAGMKLEDCREEVRKLTGLNNVILTKNCTEALNLAIFGICKKGTVLTDVFEHNSVLRPLYKLKYDGKIKLKIINSSYGEITLKEVSEALTSDTQTVVLSAMNNVTGCTSDIGEIADFLSKKRINLIVDAAQSMGHVFQKFNGVTAVCSSGHKGLHGPQGTGFLALADNAPELSPLILGGTGSEAESTIQPHTMPDGYESGTQNTLGFAGLAEGIRWTLANQIAITNKIKNLGELLFAEINSIPNIKLYSPHVGSVATFNVQGLLPSEVSDKLTERKIYLRSGLHCAPLAHNALGTLNMGGALRASLGYINTPSDIYALITALKTIAK